jgi:hypothetical protein
MITDKLNRYIYEIDYNKKFNINTLSFDEIVEMILTTDKVERQKILERLDDKIREKINAMIEGGLI